MHCLGCGYNLNQLTEPRCPECGRGFSPDDTSSWGNPRAFRFRRPAQVSGRLCWIAAVLPAIIGAVGIGIGRYDAFVILMLWAYAAVPFIVLLGVWAGCLKACGYTPGRRAWVVGLALLAFNLGLLTEWPIHLTFRLHRPALNELVLKHQAGETVSLPVQVGVFRIYDIQTIDWWDQEEPIIDLSLSPGSNGPDHLVYGMGDERYGRGATPFNIWSDRRLDKDWYIVHED